MSSEADFIVSAAAGDGWAAEFNLPWVNLQRRIYADTPEEVQKRRKAFLRQRRLRHPDA